MTVDPADRATAARRRRLCGQLAEQNVTGALITDPVNVRYLSGFTGSNGALVLPVAEPPLLVTDARYRDQAASETADLRIVVDRRLVPACARLMTQSGTWAVETAHMSVDAYRELASCIPELTSANGAVETLRRIKDPAEIATLQRACEISTAALDGLLTTALEGRTERQIARDLQWRIYERDADELAFDSIVAAGEHGAIPHHRPTDRPVGRGEMLTIDFGARLDGYHADCTRTVVLGRASDWQREVYEAVRASQAAGLEAVAAGAAVTDVWHAALGVLESAGWSEYFTTGLGHGVGLEIHEEPLLGPASSATLEAGEVVTIEPGIYVPGAGGVRIEDTVCVGREPAGTSPSMTNPVMTNPVMTNLTKELLEI